MDATTIKSNIDQAYHSSFKVRGLSGALRDQYAEAAADNLSDAKIRQDIETVFGRSMHQLSQEAQKFLVPAITRY